MIHDFFNYRTWRPFCNVQRRSNFRTFEKSPMVLPVNVEVAGLDRRIDFHSIPMMMDLEINGNYVRQVYAIFHTYLLLCVATTR